MCVCLLLDFVYGIGSDVEDFNYKKNATERQK